MLDEPTNDLDLETLDLLQEVIADYDGTVLIVSHDLSAVARLCSDVSVMQEGRIVESGSVRSVLTRPQHEHTRDLIDAVPRLT